MMGNPASWVDDNKKRNRLRKKRPNNTYRIKNPNTNHHPSVEFGLKQSNVNMLALLRNQTLYSEARILRLGPTFMSIHIPNLDIERQIHYDEVEDLRVEWLDATSTLLLGLSMHDSCPPNREIQSGRFRPLGDIAELVSPLISINDSQIITYSSCVRDDDDGKSCGLYGADLEPLFFPLTLHLKSTVPVALHAIGEGDGPHDIVARLYVTSYFH